jgi:hypothetical protein
VACPVLDTILFQVWRQQRNRASAPSRALTQITDRVHTNTQRMGYRGATPHALGKLKGNSSA